jgi:hypothetical protein
VKEFKGGRLLRKYVELKRVFNESDRSLTLPDRGPPKASAVAQGESMPARESKVLPFGEDLGGVGKSEESFLYEIP